MADNFYKDMRLIASQLIKQFDQIDPDSTVSPESNGVFYIAVTSGTGPADNPGAAIESQPLKIEAVVRGVSFKYVNNRSVVSTDLQLTTPARDGLIPEMSGFIIVDGQRHKIVEIINKPAAGIAVAHTLIFRK